MVRYLFISLFIAAAFLNTGCQSTSQPSSESSAETDSSQDSPSAAQATTQFENIGVAQFGQLMTQEGTVVLDVRTTGEYNKGHLEGAVHIDISQPDFMDRISELDKEKSYLVYCAVGGRSATACGAMTNLGFDKCFNLAGGIVAWQQAEMPVQQ